MSCLSSVAVGKIGFETDRAKKQLQDLAKAFFYTKWGKYCFAVISDWASLFLLLRKKHVFLNRTQITSHHLKHAFKMTYI